MNSRPSLSDTLKNVNSETTYNLGSPIVVGEKTYANNTYFYSISGAWELTQNVSIVPDAANEYKVGDGFSILWNSNATVGEFTISIAGFNLTAFLTGAVNTFIGLNYDGEDWQISYVDIVYPVTSVAGRTGAVTLTKSDVGLSAVENTALSTWAGSGNITTVGTIATGVWSGTAIVDGKIASAATWNAKAPTAAPTFTGNATTAVTPTYGDSSIKIPNTAFVQQAIAPLNVFYESVSTWAAGTYDLAALATGLNNIVEPLSITGNIILEALGSPATSVSEITIALPFSGGSWTITAGTNTAFSTITGADTHTSVLTLIWSGVAGKYIQKSFSQN